MIGNCVTTLVNSRVLGLAMMPDLQVRRTNGLALRRALERAQNSAAYKAVSHLSPLQGPGRCTAPSLRFLARVFRVPRETGQRALDELEDRRLSKLSKERAPHMDRADDAHSFVRGL